MIVWRLFSGFEEAFSEFLAPDGVRYAGLFGWVVICGWESAHNESPVVPGLVPEVPRYWYLGDLPITNHAVHLSWLSFIHPSLRALL
jgi:hypothetical protein